VARRPYQSARVVQLDECLITNQEAWEFESPRALHQTGSGKARSTRLPWKQEIAGSKPASLTSIAASNTARRDSSPCAGAILVLDVITFPDGREPKFNGKDDSKLESIFR
jgi:hypothetical protein